MMYGGWGGWGWMVLGPLLWILLIGVIVWTAVTLTRRSRERQVERPREETPQEILDRRFASGEIDRDSYTRARDRLAGKEPGPS